MLWLIGLSPLIKKDSVKVPLVWLSRFKAGVRKSLSAGGTEFFPFLVRANGRCLPQVTWRQGSFFPRFASSNDRGCDIKRPPAEVPPFYSRGEFVAPPLLKNCVPFLPPAFPLVKRKTLDLTLVERNSIVPSLFFFPPITRYWLPPPPPCAFLLWGVLNRIRPCVIPFLFSL